MKAQLLARSSSCPLPLPVWAVCLTSCIALLCSTGDAQTLQQLEQQAIRQATQTAAEAVVQLQIVGGSQRVDGVSLAGGPATGVVLTSDGLVVTSSYRFNPKPASTLAILRDGQRFAAQVVATDFSRKLVLLQLQDASGLKAAEVAPQESIRVGQLAIALGKTFRADQPNVSVGIVSATNRLYGRALQTDAAVSAANYGGPLIDLEGRVLGILSPMSPTSEKSIAGVEWYDSGIGFAVPLDAWQSALARLREGEDLQLGYLGVGLSDGTPRETPAAIETVVPGGPAAVAGLKAGDVIVDIAGRTIQTQVDLKFATQPHYAGDTLSINYRRDGQVQTADLQLATIANLEASAQRAADAAETDSPEKTDPENPAAEEGANPTSASVAP